MKSNLLQRNVVKMLGVVAMLLCAILTVGTKQIVMADETTKSITLKTVGEYDDKEYTVEGINGLTATSVVTFTSDNPDVVCFNCQKTKVGKNGGTEETSADVDSFTANGSEIKLDEDEELGKGTWITQILIVAKCAGNATVTINVDNAGVVTSQVYNVTVKGAKPVCKKLADKVIRTYDSTSFELDNLSDYGTVKISCNKDKGIKVTEYNVQTEKSKKILIGKTPKIVKGGSYSGFFVITPQKAGNIEIYVTIEQDGYTVKKTYKLTVVKYENPLQTFQIGGKDYAKKFNKKTNISDESGLTKKECKYTLGGKSYILKMKKGYTLEKITYRSYGEYGTKVHTLNKTSTILPKDFWELYIIYKDKKGRKWTNSVYYSGEIFY